MSRLLTVCFLAVFLTPIAIAENIVPIGDLERGMSATIKGEVTRILDEEDEFRIQDESGSIKVYIGWKNRVSFPTGEKLTVNGFVEDDLKSYFRPEFYAYEIVRVDGSVIKLH